MVNSYVTVECHERYAKLWVRLVSINLWKPIMTAQRQLLHWRDCSSSRDYYTNRPLLLRGRPDRVCGESPGGFYHFEPHIVDTVRFIQKLKNLGMSLNEIKALYQVRRDKPTGNEAYPVVLKHLQDRLCDVNKKLGEFEELREELEEAIDLVQQCHGCRMKPNRENCLACDVVKKRHRIPLPFGAIL